MSQLEPYYENHTNSLRFPWSIYHKPLHEDLVEELNKFQGKKVLCIGPGSLEEGEVLSRLGCKLDIIDIDPRVLNTVQSKFPSLVANLYLVNESFKGYPNEKYDFIYAKEVIEHIVEYETFLSKIKELMHENTKVWISTPNYGFFLLPFLEVTILELIARFKGFSRKEIHPTKFSKAKLERAFSKAKFSNFEVFTKSFDMVLVGKVNGKV